MILSTIEQELEVETLHPKNCPMMSWDQVRGLHEAGHIVGSHTVSHPNLAYVDDEVGWSEISESKIQLENRLGVPVDYFSYPNPILDPNFNDRTIQWTKRAGYKLAGTGITGPVRLGHDPFAVRRIPVPSNREEFIWYVESTLLGRQL
jgi:peptidoglycan/xylan/chitin deacetylase (PgdA/CDA1 family)